MSDRRCPSPRNRPAPSLFKPGNTAFGLALVARLTVALPPLLAQARLSGTLQVSAQVADSQSVWGGASGTDQAVQGWLQGTAPAPQSLASPVQIALLALPRGPGQDQSLLVTVEYLKN